MNQDRKHSADEQTWAVGQTLLDVVSPARTTSQITDDVRRQQPAAAGLPPVFLCPPSSCGPAHAVAVPQPACHALQPAVQWQPNSPQPHKLARLHPWRLLPASDWTHKGDGHPRPRGPLAVGCQGARLLHRGPEGKYNCFYYIIYSVILTSNLWWWLKKHSVLPLFCCYFCPDSHEPVFTISFVVNCCFSDFSCSSGICSQLHFISHHLLVLPPPPHHLSLLHHMHFPALHILSQTGNQMNSPVLQGMMTEREKPRWCSCLISFQ